MARAGIYKSEVLRARDRLISQGKYPSIDAVREDHGGVRPGHIKDRIRALGPTVRPDLTLKPADPAAGNWVI